MLAYVFWHWPRAVIGRGRYVDHLLDFHHTLAANKPRGFQKSVVFRIHGANWLNTAGEVFEDWYLLDDSAALDPLNDAAVSGACEEPHNRVASEAEGGTAGLYRLRAGEEDLVNARVAVWLSKPAGVSYKDFHDTLTPLISQPGRSLWGRQMTLGPTTEFCIHTREPLELPRGCTGRQIALDRLTGFQDIHD